MDFATPIAATKVAIDTIKALRDIDKALDSATLKAELANIMSQLADVRIALADAQEDASAKDKEIAALKQSFELRTALLEWHGYKYRPAQSDPTKKVGYPVCPRCEAVDGRLILTVKSSTTRGAKCPQCKSDFPDASNWTDPSEAA